MRFMWLSKKRSSALFAGASAAAVRTGSGAGSSGPADVADTATAASTAIGTDISPGSSSLSSAERIRAAVPVTSWRYKRTQPRRNGIFGSPGELAHWQLLDIDAAVDLAHSHRLLFGSDHQEAFDQGLAADRGLALAGRAGPRPPRGLSGRGLALRTTGLAPVSVKLLLPDLVSRLVCFIVSSVSVSSQLAVRFRGLTGICLRRTSSGQKAFLVASAGGGGTGRHRASAGDRTRHPPVAVQGVFLMACRRASS